MPRQDKTGPTGMGPATGRGMGPCGTGQGFGAGMGRGYGKAMCGWFNQKYQAIPKDEKRDLLKSEVEELNKELQVVKEELNELEN